MILLRSIIFNYVPMYFLEQIKRQQEKNFIQFFEAGPGDPAFNPETLAREAAQREAEAARPETEILAEVEAAS